MNLDFIHSTLREYFATTQETEKSTAIQPAPTDSPNSGFLKEKEQPLTSSTVGNTFVLLCIDGQSELVKQKY
jgi:hypothetical protein